MMSAQPIDKQTSAVASTAIAFAFLFVAGFCFSVWLLNIYTGGDLYHYDKFWRAVATTNWWQWASLQITYLGAADYLYGMIIGIGTYTGIDRIYFVSIFNGLLVALTGEILRRHRAHWLFYIFMMTNFYFLVLLGPAERLKFAYLFLALSVCSPSLVSRLAALAAAPLCHTQSLLQIGATGTHYVILNHRIIFKNKIRIALSVITVSALASAAGYFIYVNAGEVLAHKSELYGSQSQGIIEALQWSVVGISGLLVFRNRISFIIAMIPLGVFTAMFGSRVNIAIFVFFCWTALTENKTRNPIVIALMAYMSLKSIGFIINILVTGQGFA